MATERFSDKLRRWREQAGLSQHDLAVAVGVKQQTVSAWEQGRALPHPSRSSALEAALGQDPQVVLLALYTEMNRDVPEIVPPIDEGTDDAIPAALGRKLSKLSPEDQAYVESLVDRLLGKDT